MPEYLNYQPDFDSPEVVSIFDELSFWSSRFGALLLDNLPVRKNASILDLACGAGFPLFELAHTFGRTCRVTGVDVWRSALERARLKEGIYALSNVQLVEASGADLPFQAGEFDLVVSNLGINNFTDPEAILGECYRVLKPGGILALTTNVRGHYREFYEVYRKILEDLGRPEYLQRLEDNEAHRGSKEFISVLLEKAGFSVVRVVESHFQTRYADGSALLNHFLCKVGFMDGWRGVVDHEDEEKVFVGLENTLNRIAAEQGELRVTVPMLYLEASK